MSGPVDSAPQHDSPDTTVDLTGAQRWGWLLVLACGIALLETARRILTVTGNLRLLPTVLLIGASIVPAPFVVLIRPGMLEGRPQ